MREIKIGRTEYGQRLDRLLIKYFSRASSGFLYKMLRKKSITLNGKKAAGNEILQDGDRIQVFFSDETFEKFRRPEPELRKNSNLPKRPEIVYEDEHVLLLNKPAGMLSQKASPSDFSAVDAVTAYLLESGQLTGSSLQTFRPGVCNRLDRNTSGLLAAGKTLVGLQALNRAFAERTLGKFYLCPVDGLINETMELRGYLEKNEKTNQAAVYPDPGEGRTYVRTNLRPIETAPDATLLQVELLTGKTHQIRAHLASISHPVLGDPKYGNRAVNERLRKRFQLKYQLLHAYQLAFPPLDGPLGGLSGKTFTAPLPEQFKRVWEGLAGGR